jgi:hypothetical protein
MSACACNWFSSAHAQPDLALIGVVMVVRVVRRAKHSGKVTVRLTALSILRLAAHFGGGSLRTGIAAFESAVRVSLMPYARPSGPIQMVWASPWRVTVPTS